MKEKILSRLEEIAKKIKENNDDFHIHASDVIDEEEKNLEPTMLAAIEIATDLKTEHFHKLAAFAVLTECIRKAGFRDKGLSNISLETRVKIKSLILEKLKTEDDTHSLARLTHLLTGYLLVIKSTRELPEAEKWSEFGRDVLDLLSHGSKLTAKWIQTRLFSDIKDSKAKTVLNNYWSYTDFFKTGLESGVDKLSLQTLDCLGNLLKATEADGVRTEIFKTAFEFIQKELQKPEEIDENTAQHFTQFFENSSLYAGKELADELTFVLEALPKLISANKVLPTRLKLTPIFGLLGKGLWTDASFLQNEEKIKRVYEGILNYMESKLEPHWADGLSQTGEPFIIYKDNKFQMLLKDVVTLIGESLSKKEKTPWRVFLRLAKERFGAVSWKRRFVTTTTLSGILNNLDAHIDEFGEVLIAMAHSAVKDQDWRVRDAALVLIRNLFKNRPIGFESQNWKEIQDMLVELLNDCDPRIKRRAFQSLLILDNWTKIGLSDQTLIYMHELVIKNLEQPETEAAHDMASFWSILLKKHPQFVATKISTSTPALLNVLRQTENEISVETRLNAANALLHLANKFRHLEIQSEFSKIASDLMAFTKSLDPDQPHTQTGTLILDCWSTLIDIDSRFVFQHLSELAASIRHILDLYTGKYPLGPKSHENVEFELNAVKVMNFCINTSNPDINTIAPKAFSGYFALLKNAKDSTVRKQAARGLLKLIYVYQLQIHGPLKMEEQTVNSIIEMFYQENLKEDQNNQSVFLVNFLLAKGFFKPHENDLKKLLEMCYRKMRKAAASYPTQDSNAISSLDQKKEYLLRKLDERAHLLGKLVAELMERIPERSEAAVRQMFYECIKTEIMASKFQAPIFYPSFISYAIAGEKIDVGKEKTAHVVSMCSPLALNQRIWLTRAQVECVGYVGSSKKAYFSETLGHSLNDLIKLVQSLDEGAKSIKSYRGARDATMTAFVRLLKSNGMRLQLDQVKEYVEMFLPHLPYKKNLVAAQKDYEYLIDVITEKIYDFNYNSKTFLEPFIKLARNVSERPETANSKTHEHIHALVKKLLKDPKSQEILLSLSSEEDRAWLEKQQQNQGTVEADLINEEK